MDMYVVGRRRMLTDFRWKFKRTEISWDSYSLMRDKLKLMLKNAVVRK
jgi:hypothetical protein